MRQLLLPFRTKLNFYSVPRHFKKVEVKREVSDFASSYFWKVYRLVHFYRKDKKEVFEPRYGKQELIDKIHQAFDEWSERLNGQKYHGGDEFGPDACDFRMYSEISRLGQTFIMKGIISSRPKGCAFANWYKLMDRGCDPTN